MERSIEQKRLAYTVREFAAGVSCSIPTVARMLKSGRLKGVRLNTHSIRIPATEVDRILAGQTLEVPPPVAARRKGAVS
jgi:excisionase family DNA binding protein